MVVASHRPRPRLAVLIALLGLGALALPACGPETEAASLERSTTTTASTTTTTVPTTTTAAPTMPLTGLPVVDPAAAARPALVVKIDNIDTNRGRARPQAGLNQADVVHEELVEGGITRFLTVFHSADADPVGPVRSARTSDIAIFSALNHPLFAWSGAASWVVPQVRSSGAIDIGHDLLGDAAYYRRRDRRAPHNLFSSTQTLYGVAAGQGGTPPPQFTYRAPEDFLGSAARPVGGVDLGFGGGLGSVPVQYRWDPAQNGWARFQGGTPHVDDAGIVVAPQNVIVQFAPYGLEGDSPVAQVVGSGPAWVFTNGHLVEGTWSKSTPEAVTQYLDRVGQPIGLTPGRTWVAVLPSGGGAVGSAVVV